MKPSAVVLRAAFFGLALFAGGPNLWLSPLLYFIRWATAFAQLASLTSP
jgi:hypothetical protein